MPAGPGLNDNGSGSIAILDVALQLSKHTVNNAVRFAWWSAEELGLVGSTYYVKSLPQKEREKIRLYINFDMLASPNFVYEIYDGDGSSFGRKGPPGSAEVEKLWKEYFRSEIKLPFAASPFDGRSDYGPFLRAGIAAGGLTTGADRVKTKLEAQQFGGTAGQILDPNYHQSTDTLGNCNMTAWTVMTKAIAHAVAIYGNSWKGFPSKGKRDLEQSNAYEFDRMGDFWVALNHTGVECAKAVNCFI